MASGGGSPAGAIWIDPTAGGWVGIGGQPSIACAPNVYQPGTTVSLGGSTAWPQPARLSDEDVDRIARRVVELLRTDRAAEREAKLHAAGFDPVSDDQRAANATVHELMREVKS